MTERVIADFVPFRNNLFYDLFVTADIFAYDEESRLNVIFSQNVENQRCFFAMRTVIKCEGDLVLFGITHCIDLAMIDVPFTERSKTK